MSRRHKSAKKAARQSLRRYEQNRAVRSHVKTMIKKIKEVIQQASSADREARERLDPLLRQTQKILMKAVSKGIIARKTASRHIAKVSSSIHRILKKSSQEAQQT